ncbi:unnamed protein product [Cuscuta campestris]|uniref:Galactose oxidase-like Early set domain-containing protein n=1 Tax=Cuscuta campestris TaxID=132261 RepID=A0A484KUN2_9ASTE|nr:unnamed protein product [Cuscuta campestris]VFQ67619.1 unnamed protein product [Cuscuta campestris]
MTSKIPWKPHHLFLLSTLFVVSAMADDVDSFQDFFRPGSSPEAFPVAGKPDFEMDYGAASWEIASEFVGVSAMHMQLMIDGKVVFYDTTNLGPSALRQNPKWCRKAPNGRTDCWAHGVTYDPNTGGVRALKINFNPWCSSGGLSKSGKLISTGGSDEGVRSIRILEPCDTCDFQEIETSLSTFRWYATQQMLENGDIMLVGGRGAHNYEIFPPDQLKFPIQQFGLTLLMDTTAGFLENNLYPFVYLLPDGTVFVFANDRSVVVNPRTGETVRELPKLPGGSRNYPASGQSALLPLKLGPNTRDGDPVRAEVLVCGGNSHDAFRYTERAPRKFPPALKECGRIAANEEGANWEIEEMPSGRVMGDMLILPTGDLLLINGAKSGTSAWDAAEDPNFAPVMYGPDKPKGKRFNVLKESKIARMYHSSSAVLPDGKILVAGSNTHAAYNFKAKYPTEMRVEKFSPPYLAAELAQFRPQIAEDLSDKQLSYGQNFNVHIDLEADVGVEDIKVTMYPPPFTTHGFSQGQRLLILGLNEVRNKVISAVAPPSGKLAPPGYYLLFVVHRGVPSKGMWVQIQ